jgi:hypothetical protein
MREGGTTWPAFSFFSFRPHNNSIAHRNRSGQTAGGHCKAAVIHQLSCFWFQRLSRLLEFFGLFYREAKDFAGDQNGRGHSRYQ